MDIEDREDMLFGYSSQETLNEVDSRSESEETMLVDGYDSDMDIWDSQGDPVLTIPLTDLDQDEDMLDFADECPLELNDFSSIQHTGSLVRDRNWVISRVEGILEGLVDGLLEDGNDLSITLKTRSGTDRRNTGPTRHQEGVLPSKSRKINFPGANAQEAWRFTVVLRILELIHDCLVEDVVLTKRDIYYRHPDLFVKQSTVDRYVDEIACTFGISRSSLNVTAAAKGLVAGNFTLRRIDGSLVNGLAEKEGVLVPTVHPSDLLDLSSIRWVIVIEKEATFRSLLSSAHWMRLGPEILVVTAKGYPDLASRKFLRRVADSSPHVPMFALVDFDPDGIAIMSTYKYGSSRLAHENITSTGVPALCLPQLRWLGVQGFQLYRSLGTNRDQDSSPLLDTQGIMRLTPRDRTKACRMLEWDVCAENGPEPAWRRELQRMLMLNVKAEMQVLESMPGGIVSWLESEIGSRQG